MSEVPETAPTSFVIVELATPPRQAFRFAEQADALRLAERLRRADPDAAVRTETPEEARAVLLELAFVPEDAHWPADHHGVAASRPRDRGGPLPSGGRRMTLRTATRARGAGITCAEPRRSRARQSECGGQSGRLIADAGAGEACCAARCARLTCSGPKRGAPFVRGTAPWALSSRKAPELALQDGRCLRGCAVSVGWWYHPV